MIRRVLFSLLTASSIYVSAQDQSRLSTDIIATYSEMIAANPASADLYLSRATEYVSQGFLSPALSDLNDALRLVAKGDKELRFEILSQRALIQEKQKDYEAALADVEEAMRIFPDISSLTLTKARVLTGLGRFQEARDCYSSHRRINPRSTEAIFGLAKVSALEGNSDRALALMNEGIEVAPNAGESYVAAASIHSMLGRHEEEIADYISAIACGDDGAAVALQKLVDLSADNYPRVINGLNSAINKAPTAGELYFLRGTIAQDHDHHTAAIADFNLIDGSGPFAGGILGEAIAESQLALNKADGALAHLERVPNSARKDSWHELRARILSVLDRDEDALSEINEALLLAPSNVNALATKARILYRMGRNDEANAVVTEALMIDSSSVPEIYFIGMPTLSGQRKEMLLDEACELPYDPADPVSLRGFALLALGRTDEALVWASSVDRFDTTADGVAQFTAACLYAQAGKPEESLSSLKSAIDAGFDNVYLISVDTTPGISIEPLWTDTRFTELIKHRFGK